MKYRYLKHNEGQTVVEYVLVLTAVLIVVLGTVYQLNQNFRNYAQNYFGAYLTCLLESGELPNLGIDQDPNSFCDTEHVPFSVALGRPSIEGANTDSDSNSASNNQGGGGSAGGDDSGGGDGSEAGANQSGRAANFSQPGALGSNASLRPSRITVDPNESGADNEENSESGGVTTRNVRRSYNNPTTRQDSINQQSGRPRFFAASQIEQEEVQGQSIRGEVDGEEGQVLRKKKIEQEIPQRKVATLDEEEGLGLGNFIRYLIIAAIIIALLLFLLGQLLQIQKSMEKG